MKIIKPDQQKVMSLAMIGKDVEKISTLTGLSETEVSDILSDPSLQSMMQDIEISSLSNKLSITRLR